MSAVEPDSFPAKRGNVSGGARDAGVSSGREGGVLLLLAKVGQDPVDDVPFLNASDDFDGPTAATTNFNKACKLPTAASSCGQ